MIAVIDELNSKFGLEGKIEFFEHKGMVKLRASSKQSTLECYLHGAHVTSFIVDDRTELLWLSPLAKFEEGKAIRGGVPICWPWFGPHPDKSSLSQHGFARNSLFEMKDTVELDNGDLEIVLSLSNNQATMEVWPYLFRLEARITFGTCLSIELITHNLDDKPFAITEAIHSYFKVADVSSVRINGLQGAKYYDQLLDEDILQSDLSCSFEGEVDRIYQVPCNEINIISDDGPKVILKQENGNAVVVWNPWIEKSKSMGDFPDAGYTSMLCVEAANTRYQLINLEPGEKHSIKQIMNVSA